MKNRRIEKLCLMTLLPVVLSSQVVLADSWTLTQAVTVTSSAPQSITQSGTTSASRQAANIINLSGVDGTLNDGSTQNLDIGAHALALLQENGSSNSTQAVNTVFAHTVNGAIQKLDSAGAALTVIELTQSADIDDNNTQAINAVETSSAGQVNKLTQEVKPTDNSVNIQQLGGTGNVQAGNLITTGAMSTTSGNVTQEYTVNTSNFAQTSTTNGLQAGNGLIILGGGSGGTLSQSFASDVTSVVGNFKQTSVTSSIQSMNYAGKAL